MKLFKPSLHLILGLPWFLVCPWGVQKVNAGCPMVACSSRHMTSPIPFESAYHFRALSLSLVFSLRVQMQMARDVRITS